MFFTELFENFISDLDDHEKLHILSCLISNYKTN